MRVKIPDPIKRLPYKYSLAGSILLLILPILMLVSSLFYYQMYENLNESMEDQQQQVEANIRNTITNVDKSLKLLERTFEDSMREAFVLFREAYNNSGGNPENIDLNQLKNDLGDRFDLYIINSSCTIEFATYEPDLNLNFDELGDFCNRLETVRMGDNFTSDRITPETRTGIIRKFAYMPSPDHQYVLELGIVSDEFTDLLEDLSFIQAAEDLANQSAIVKEVKVFDRTYHLFGDPSYEPSTEELNRLKNIYETKQNVDVDVHDSPLFKRYLYIDLDDHNYPTDASKMVEITYDLSWIIQETNNLTVTFLVVTIVSVLATLVVTFFMASRVTNPIYHIVDGVEKISKGDFDYRIELDTQNEISLIVASINKLASDTQTLIDRLNAVERERLHVTLRSINEGVISTDIQGNIVLMNEAAVQLTGWGWEDTKERNLSDVIIIRDEDTGETLGDIVQKTIQTRSIFESRSCVLTQRTGKEVLVECSSAPLLDDIDDVSGVVVVIRDITERRRIEDERQKIDKIESLGILAGGIAHDYNNFLTVVKGNIGIARALAGDNCKVVETLDRIEEATTRAQHISQQFLTFSKGAEPVKQIQPLQPLVEETFELSLGGTKVEVNIDDKGFDWWANIDVGQIRQVLLNIIRNAVEAMDGKGKVWVTFTIQDVRPTNDVITSALMEGSYVVLSIRDEGPGIPKQIISKIFDPYFTTKPSGNGLGLASSYSIIKKHCGTIIVESKEGEGAIFNIYLPAYKPQEALDEPPISNVHDNDDSEKRRMKVLVVDDNEAIVQIWTRVLEQKQISVVGALNDVEAVQKFRASEFDFVILDLVIPGSKSGDKILKDLRQIDPDIIAVVSSGYSDDPIIANYSSYGFQHSLPKPYASKDLLELVQRIVEAKKC